MASDTDRCSLAAAVDVVGHELDEVLGPVDDGLLGRGLVDVRVFAGPDGLSRGAVAVEAGAAGRDPVAEAFAGVGEVAVPADGCGAVRFGVVGIQPVQVPRTSSSTFTDGPHTAVWQ